MKRFGKIALAVLIAASMLCGSLTPAFGWVDLHSELRSPDGTNWFVITAESLAQWKQPPEGTDTTVYSRNGTNWYTLAGVSYYMNTAQMPDETWMSQTLSPDFVSPDGGLMWFRWPEIRNWLDWDEIWFSGDVSLSEMPLYLYGSTNSFVLRTEQAGDFSIPHYIYEYNVGSYLTSAMRTDCSFSVESDIVANVLLSTNGVDWMAMLNDAMWYDVDANANSNGILFPCVSFDPQSRMFTFADMSCPYEAITLTRSISDQNGYYVRRNVYLKSVTDCTVRLNMEYDAPDSVYCMMDLNGLMMSGDAQVSCQSDGTGILSPYYGCVILNRRAQGYYPVSAPVDGVYAIDSNDNGIIDQTDYMSDPNLLRTEYIQPVTHATVTLQMQAYVGYMLPVYFWAEGQSICSSCPQGLSAANFRLQIHKELGEDEQVAYPFTYAENENSVSITNLDSDYFRTDLHTYPSQLLGGFSFDADTGVLTLPETIDGKPVTELQRACLYAATSSGMTYGLWDTIGTVIVPVSVQTIQPLMFGDAVQTVHVPGSAQIYPETFMLCNNMLTICSDVANSLAQQTLEQTGMQQNYRFVVCQNHATHTHSFGDWAITTPASCEANGEKTRTCPICGAVETETIPASGHQFGDWTVTTPATEEADGEEERTCANCSLTETRAIPKLIAPASLTLTAPDAPLHAGDTVDVSVVLTSNPGLAGLSLSLVYDADVLTLTGVRAGGMLLSGTAQPGGDLHATPFRYLWYDSTFVNHTETGTILTFSFAVNADAPVGKTTVTMTYEADSTFNRDLQNVPLTITGKQLTIGQRKPGDADGDGELSLKDATRMMQYLAGGFPDADTLDVRNADVDGDGKLTLKDVVLVHRYIVGGWGVVLQ